MEGFDGLMGERNTHVSYSSLHSEMEALIWEMDCMKNLRQFTVTFATDCFGTRRMAGICKLFVRYQDLEEQFP